MIRSVIGLSSSALCLFFACPAMAQVNDAIAIKQKAENKAVSIYHSALGSQAHLFSGSEFISYPIYQGEHQYFKYNDLQESSITYEGLEYKQVSLLYDIVNDDVIVGRYNEQGATKHLKIDKNRVSEFSLPGHTFIHIRGNSFLENGFYEQLYKGNLQVLAKRKKNYKKEVVTITFPVGNQYYIYKDGAYHTVKSKGSVLKLLKDHKKELNSYLKANHIIFSQNRERAIAALAKQYDLLIEAK